MGIIHNRKVRKF